MGIIIFNLVLFFILKNVKKFLLVGSVITILSGYLVILLGYLLRIYIKENIKYINISVLINYFLVNNTNNGIILILFGCMMLIGYVILLFLDVYKKEELVNNSPINSVS